VKRARQNNADTGRRHGLARGRRLAICEAGKNSKEPGERTMDILRIILAIILPPLGVFLQVGLGLHFWLNILLTLLGYIPGIIHAIWIIAKR
jgi:uncharacterized membrane protein YqaE (UPF0057 family)